MPKGARRPVDAVVVAAARPAAHLATSADVAASLGAVLVALCSRRTRLSEVAELAAKRPTLEWAAIEVPPGYDHPLLSCATSRCGEAKVARLGDLSTKRNLGLLLARRLAWPTVLLLDDDIFDIEARVVRRASSALGRRASLVGLPVADFPDNSVVCHANRLGGGGQEVFVGGSALLVDSSRALSFFPEVYNEDWLFLCDALAARKVAVGEPVHQLPYQPFRSPDRAAAEEFGDVLAEGMVGLLHDGRPLAEAAGTRYWQRFLTCRAEFIEGVALRLADLADVEGRQAALQSLSAAEARRAALAPGLLAAYYRTWRADVALWAARLGDLEPAESFGKAVADLGLQAEVGSRIRKEHNGSNPA